MLLHAALCSCSYFVYFYVFHIRSMSFKHYADCSYFMISVCNLAELHISLHISCSARHGITLIQEVSILVVIVLLVSV